MNGSWPRPGPPYPEGTLFLSPSADMIDLAARIGRGRSRVSSTTIKLSESYDFDGALGEEVFGCLIGRRGPGNLPGGTDGGVDFRTAFGRIDVKASRNLRPLRVVVPPKNAGLTCDAYVLVWILGGRPDAAVVGWATREDVESAPVHESSRTYYVIEPERLRRADELVGLIDAAEVRALRSKMGGL